MSDDAAPPAGRLERAVAAVRAFRARAPKVFDIACAVAVGFAIAAIWVSSRG